MIPLLMRLRQAEHAVRNIVRLIEGRESLLEAYTVPPAGIKVSLGLVSVNRTGSSSALVLMYPKLPETRCSPDEQTNLREDGELL